MGTKLSPLTKTTKGVINTIATHFVMHGMADHLKSMGVPNADQLASNFLDSLTPKQHQIIRALTKDIRDTKLELAKSLEQGEK
ncbi:MAG: hypothetical protein Q9N62_01575 [Ghiorsea sp.]|nr:hypothetical protein [Ghiorsea sp.]